MFDKYISAEFLLNNFTLYFRPKSASEIKRACNAVTSPTGKDVIVMGGTGANSKAIFELTQSVDWTRLEQTLQIDHNCPLAIPIPDELISKQD